MLYIKEEKQKSLRRYAVMDFMPPLLILLLPKMYLLMLVSVIFMDLNSFRFGSFKLIFNFILRPIFYFTLIVTV